jgi:hypothetical protein
MLTRALLGNRFVKCNNGVTGKRNSLRGPCDSYVMQQNKMLGEVFSMLSVSRFIRSQLCVMSEFGSWKSVSTVRKLQLKSASQRRQEPLETKAENATTLVAATKQRSKDRDGER